MDAGPGEGERAGGVAHQRHAQRERHLLAGREHPGDLGEAGADGLGGLVAPERAERGPAAGQGRPALQAHPEVAHRDRRAVDDPARDHQLAAGRPP